MGRGWFLVATILLVTAGCVDRAPDVPGDSTLSCGTREYWSYDPKDIYFMDTLLVVDRSAGAAQPAVDLFEFMGQVGRVLDESDHLSLHIGVVAADERTLDLAPQTGSCSVPEAAFLERTLEPYFRCGNADGESCPGANFDGSLAEILPCVAVPPRTDVAERMPLRAAADALEAARGFRQGVRETIGVLIVVNGDDESPLPVEHYIERLDAAAGDGNVLLAIVAPAGSERLARAAELVPRTVFVDAATPSWLRSIYHLVERRILLPQPCLDGVGADAVPGNPGLQPRCVVSAGGAGGQVLPACTMETPTRPAPDSPWPCWWVEPDSIVDCEAEPRTEGVTSTTWTCEPVCEAD